MNIRDIQIKNHAGHFQRAIRTIYQRAGCDQVFLTNEVKSRKLPATRIDVMFVKGPSTETSLNEAGEEIQDGYQSRIVTTISTKREVEQFDFIDGVGSLHEQWAAAIDAALEFKENPFKDLLPFYTVTQLREGPSERDLDPRLWVDFTRLVHQVEYSINSNAWTVPYTG